MLYPNRALGWFSRAMCRRPPIWGGAARRLLISIPAPSSCRQQWGGVGNRGAVGLAPEWWLSGKWLLADGGPLATLATAYASLGFLADIAVRPQPSSSPCLLLPSFQLQSITGRGRRWGLHLYGFSLFSRSLSWFLGSLSQCLDCIYPKYE